ncbi:MULTISPECIES: XdhC family protein [unclassified Sphingomonas]|uniref:XdhC family protein n=1 Tax=unclassified Sphingomonas TaxID=196159 RepID=UPI000E73A594|nr:MULTISPECIES: XdhC family protein [unclassified Sphingomonas]RKE42758.1 xanthine dehydrogenase accessory factor [Sphingomonas sp. PP-CC-1A-547]TCM05540.1 xanthine dehydrogenase accessory factor [Sphingomonas sp. PP-CC-3G-468]
MKQALAILRFLRDCAKRGERAALVTLTDVTGSAARAPGEHMAVAESGRSLGSFSGGCVEAAVIAEAQEVLAEGRARHVRYGDGSRYIDIRLPCGGGIDLLFTPAADRQQIDCAIAVLERREPLTLRLTLVGDMTAARSDEDDRTQWHDTAFIVRHEPVLRLVVMGHGAEPAAMLDIARAYGAEVVLLSPQNLLVEDAREKGMPAELLRFVGRVEGLMVDPWTAVITLFHDHDWETPLLLQVLEQRPFFVGAMGSMRTHLERQRRLLDAGADTGDIARVTGPVGLIKATRDPQTLALSIMAQVVQAYGLETASDHPSSARWSMSHPHGFIEQHARSDPGGGALQSSTIFDVDQTLTADARFDRKEEEAHAQRI